jgi:hypothetical protein
MNPWYLFINTIVVVIALAVAVAAVWVGYWMGRNSSDLPLRSMSNPKLIDQGPTDDPGGDPFEEAMEAPEPVSPEEERIDTMRS